MGKYDRAKWTTLTVKRSTKSAIIKKMAAKDTYDTYLSRVMKG